MTTHYFDIEVDEKLNPASFFGRLMYRIHGYCTRQPGRVIAVDFPRWKKPSGLMAAQTGNLLRIMGSQADLADFLGKTGIVQLLIEGGFSVAGIKEVPQGDHSLFVVRRHYRIERNSELIENPQSIRCDKVSRSVPDNIKHLAQELKVSDQTMLALEKIIEKVHNDKRHSVCIKVKSESSGGHFLMYIERIPAKKTGSAGSFSSYGLSVDGACIPSW